ncbi:MAG: protein translocase subunit SecD [Clostridiales bacterium]|jgi:protein-export membrane protein SecD|nr:protein translocase subunit SecD [Clostridiales bacterium]
MKKKSSIVKLSIVGFLIVVGIVLSVVSFPVGFNHDYTSFARAIKLGLDLKGGVYAVYEANNDNVDDFSSKLNGTRTRLQDMLVGKGYAEARVTAEGTNRLRVEVPDVDNPSQVFTLIGQPAEIEFVLDESDVVVIRGDDVKSASAGYGGENGEPTVSLELTTAGGNRFFEHTSANVGKTMSIYRVVDGSREERPISTATINEGISGGKVAITMSGTDLKPAQDLADQINSGTFAVNLALLESSTVPPSLGGQALFYSLIAAGVGLFLLMAFLIWRYRLMGVVASIALCAYCVLIVMFLAIFPWVQLTLPGIAGIILSIGMAVDGNVVIYERIRDEYAGGKSILAAYYAGFKRALAPIIDGNVTTIIAAFILLFLGGSSLNGFGVTLLIGIVLSVLTSLVITRFLLKWFLNLNSTDPKLYNLKRGKNVTVTEEDGGDAEAPDSAKIPAGKLNEGASA